MKKLLSTILALTLVLALAACDEKTSNETENNSTNSDVASVETSNDVEVSNGNNEEVSADTSSNVEWRQFLSEYEDWVDEYIEITEKYKNNTSDISILSDYSDMMTEMAEWTSKTEEMEKELENASPTELAEYTAELARIAGKIAQVAN